MNPIQALVLGAMQGATEFIPVSSSAHLVLVPWAFGWPSPGLAFDTVLHLGTLLALLLVFWRDLWVLATVWLQTTVSFVLQRVRRPAASTLAHAAVLDSDARLARLAWSIILGTIPAALMGALWEDQFQALFDSPQYVAAFLLVTGLWLWAAERYGRQRPSAEDLSWRQSLLVGLAQGCAITPGISRSGATIGAGLLLGLRRDAATSFSFLLSTPIILGAGVLQLRKLLQAPGLDAAVLPLGVGFVAALVSGYACIRFLLRFVQERSLTIVARYCWLAGLSAMLLYWLR